MKYSAFLLVFFLSATARPANAANVEHWIKELKPFIGSYPPNFKSKSKQDIERKYDAAKKQADIVIAKSPGDLEQLFNRGRLQSMGYNMDREGAWKGAEDDFISVLEKKPDHEGALVELGSLYVNGAPKMLAVAGGLFRSAQKAHGKKPLLGAQRGLYFTYYYQGKMRDALAQAEFLARTWPDDPMYKTFIEMTREKLSKGESPRVIQVPNP